MEAETLKTKGRRFTSPLMSISYFNVLSLMSKFQNRCISFNGVLYVNFHWFVQVEWMHICICAYMIHQLIYMYILIYIIYVHNNICILGRHIVVVNGVYTALKALSQSNRHAINWTQNKNISQDPKYKGFIGKHNRENIILKLPNDQSIFGS